jgi:hypothetical protein
MYVFSVRENFLNSHSKGTSVQFGNNLPDVIGYDGGLANLYSDDENENTSDTDSVVEELSFTEEERSFVLLALENTIWNSEVKNLNNDSFSLTILISMGMYRNVLELLHHSLLSL